MAHEDDAFCFVEKLSPPLWQACKNGFFDVVVTEIQEFGVDVNQRGGRYNTTPLMQAARYNRITTLERLLDENAGMEERDDRGYTAAQLASAAGHMQILSILAINGADLDAPIGKLQVGCKHGGRFCPTACRME